MIKAAWSGADGADAIVHLMDASCWVAERKGGLKAAQKLSIEDDRRVISRLQESGTRALLALNKIDLFAHEEVLPVIAGLKDTDAYEEVFMISASNGDGVDVLLAELARRMPEGPALYPPDQTADLPMRLLAAEITREKLMLRLHQELPYQLMVETESWDEKKDGSVRIQQVITVGREGHKAMVLGKGGAGIREIGKLAREELAQLLGRKVHLFLFVKTDATWQDKRATYSGLGLDFDA